MEDQVGYGLANPGPATASVAAEPARLPYHLPEVVAFQPAPPLFGHSVEDRYRVDPVLDPGLLPVR